MPIKTQPRVAIIHDWLVTFRGGERVLEALLELYPQAEIFTLFHASGQLPQTIEKHKIHVSFLNRFPQVQKYYRHLLPLMPMAIEHFDLSRFDLVISSSHCVAKGVIVGPHALHVCYCHTPMRYVWDRYTDYFQGSTFEPLILPFAHYLRMWDVTSSARVDHFITNSRWVGRRIEKYYRRESEAIHPFVDLEGYQPTGEPREDYYLVVSAFAPYKKVELAIEATRRKKRPLWIVGDGQESSRLRAAAGDHVRFLGSLEREALRKVYSQAKALLFPGEEDFGITPLEAMACGTPVIAYGRGGVTESVIEGETGLFFPEQTAESLADAIDQFEFRPERYTVESCRRRSEEFSRKRFQHEFQTTLNRFWDDKHRLGISRLPKNKAPVINPPQAPLFS